VCRVRLRALRAVRRLSARSEQRVHDQAHRRDGRPPSLTLAVAITRDSPARRRPLRRRRPAAESPRAPAGGWREVADGHPCLLKPATWRVGAASAAIMAMQVAAEAAPTPRLQPFAVELAVPHPVAEVDQATQRHPD